jgi:hypothetical protein
MCRASSSTAAPAARATAAASATRLRLVADRLQRRADAVGGGVGGEAGEGGGEAGAVGVDADHAERRRAQRRARFQRGHPVVGPGVRADLEELDVADGQAGVGQPRERLARHRRAGRHRVLVLALGDRLDTDADEVVARLGGGGDEVGRAEGQQGEMGNTDHERDSFSEGTRSGRPDFAEA